MRVVLRETGRPMQEWIRERRRRRTGGSPAETDFPVAELGRRVGYTDPSTSFRSFRRAHDPRRSSGRAPDARGSLHVTSLQTLGLGRFGEPHRPAGPTDGYR
jgi:hypothetical protein